MMMRRTYLLVLFGVLLSCNVMALGVYNVGDVNATVSVDTVLHLLVKNDQTPRSVIVELAVASPNVTVNGNPSVAKQTLALASMQLATVDFTVRLPAGGAYAASFSARDASSAGMFQSVNTVYFNIIGDNNTTVIGGNLSQGSDGIAIIVPVGATPNYTVTVNANVNSYIFVDNVAYGQIPVKVNVTAGSHTFKAVAVSGNYWDAYATYTVMSNQSIDMTLSPVVGSSSGGGGGGGGYYFPKAKVNPTNVTVAKPVTKVVVPVVNKSTAVSTVQEANMPGAKELANVVGVVTDKAKEEVALAEGSSLSPLLILLGIGALAMQIAMIAYVRSDAA